MSDAVEAVARDDDVVLAVAEVIEALHAAGWVRQEQDPPPEDAMREARIVLAAIGFDRLRAENERQAKVVEAARRLIRMSKLPQESQSWCELRDALDQPTEHSDNTDTTESTE